MSFWYQSQNSDRSEAAYVNSQGPNTSRDGRGAIVVPCMPATPVVQRPGHQSAMPVLCMSLSEIVNNDKEFCVAMDVQQFKAEEINIRIRENRLTINARHEERADGHGFIMREFSRQYVLPEDIDPDTVTSVLTGDGVLTLRAPKRAAAQCQERTIPITYERTRHAQDTVRSRP